MTDRTDTDGLSETDLLACASEIVSAYVSRNAVGQAALPDLIRTVHGSLSHLGAGPVAAPREKQKPAVPVSKSVQRDYIVCLEDGAHLKMLKRYLRSRFGLSPEEYRRKWGLPPDYPMVAPAYAERRSDFARKIGLGKGVRRRS
ncbi:MAG: MucR family transcriptional regulator [Caulobacter sp.]|nr:MucR family transcriptional regulator [Caulobacter sp.]